MEADKENLNEKRHKKVKRTMVAKIAKKIKSWRSFAPYLGLEPREISDINVDGHDEQEKRQRMLFLWRKKKGNHATYYKLIEALEEYEDQDTIDYIHQCLAKTKRIIQSPTTFHSDPTEDHLTDTQIILKKYGPTLLKQISKKPYAIGKLLWHEGIISTTTLDKIEDDEGAAIMQDVSNQNIEDIRKTASILLHNKHTASVATKILSDAIIIVPSDQKSHFNKFRTNLTVLFDKVTYKIMNKGISHADLVDFLGDTFDELEPRLRQTSTIAEVLKIVCQESTIVDISYLDELVKYFEVDDAKEDIQEYQKMIEEECKALPLHVCFDQHFKEPFSTPLQRNTIIFVLEWEPSDKHLQNIDDLLNKAFARLAKVVQVIKIEKTNSIKVTCYAPHKIMIDLIKRAKENLKHLEDEGVMSLFMGYHMILDHQSSDKIEMKRLKDFKDAYQLILSKQYKEKEDLQSRLDQLQKQQLVKSEMLHTEQETMDTVVTAEQHDTLQHEQKMDIAVSVSVTGNTITINYEHNALIDIPQIQLTGIYSTSTQIVIFGERNFTFSTALASLRGGVWKGITATTTSSFEVTFQSAHDMSQQYSVKNTNHIDTNSESQYEAQHCPSQLKLLDDPPANTWLYGVNITDNNIDVKNKVVWLQCPWIPLYDRTSDHNIGSMIMSFIKYMNTKQDKGDYLLLGIVNLFPYVKEYKLKKVLCDALNYDNTDRVHGYTLLGGDNNLVNKILQHGYTHETVYAKNDIHFKIINYHLTLVFQKLQC